MHKSAPTIKRYLAKMVTMSSLKNSTLWVSLQITATAEYPPVAPRSCQKISMTVHIWLQAVFCLQLKITHNNQHDFSQVVLSSASPRNDNRGFFGIGDWHLIRRQKAAWFSLIRTEESTSGINKDHQEDALATYSLRPAWCCLHYVFFLPFDIR